MKVVEVVEVVKKTVGFQTPWVFFTGSTTFTSFMSRE